MKLINLSKIAIASLVSLGLTLSPVVLAKNTDTTKKSVQSIKEKSSTKKKQQLKKSQQLKAKSKQKASVTQKKLKAKSKHKASINKDKLKAKSNKKISKSTKQLKSKKVHKMKNAKVNINKANKQQLMSALNGVGEKKAQAIIDYRKKNGAFKSTKDLLNVKGFGKKMLKKNQANLTLKGQALVEGKVKQGKQLNAKVIKQKKTLK